MKQNGIFELALVTGASSGIGEALCRLLASKGIPLLITGRNQERLDQLANELSKQVKVDAFIADLSNRSERALVVDKIYNHVPDLLINNAGFGTYGDVLTHETKKQMDILEVDGAALMELAIEAARALVSLEKPGVILNVSSAAAFQIMPSFTVYSATKAFVNAFSESFDQEVQRYSIRVLAACPGMVNTRFRERAANGESASTQKEPLTMSKEFAAEQIWKQILEQKTVRIFDWKYRILAFLSRTLPTSWSTSLVRKAVEGRHKPRMIITRKKS